MVRTNAIIAFLREQITPADFARSIDSELRTHLAALSKTGASAPIIVDEGAAHVVTTADIATLDRAVAAGHLSTDAGAYVADAIIMADNLDEPEDDDAIDRLYAIANP